MRVPLLRYAHFSYLKDEIDKKYENLKIFYFSHFTLNRLFYIIMSEV